MIEGSSPTSPFQVIISTIEFLISDASATCQLRYYTVFDDTDYDENTKSHNDNDNKNSDDNDFTNHYHPPNKV